LDSDPKCVEALLTQLSARLASGHINDKYVNRVFFSMIDTILILFNLINVFSANWMFNIVLFDAAPLKRRSSIRHGGNKEKYENLL